MDVKALIQQFIGAHNNVFISILKPGRQCFDLAVKWTDLLNVPHFPGNPSPFPYANAYEIYTKPNDVTRKYFDFIQNTPDAIPQAGDIVVWDKTLNGGIGHVAVANGNAGTSYFESFDQNWVPGTPCKIIRHSYNYVLGWLRLKVANTQPMDDNIKRKSSFFDIIWLEEFGQNTNTDQATEGQVREFIKVLKTRREGNGQWDLIKKEAGFVGQTVNYMSVVTKLKEGATGLAEYKQKVKDLITKLLAL